MKPGLWHTVGGLPLSDKVEASIYHQGQYSTTVVSGNVHPRDAELILVSLFGSSIDYLGISQRGRRAATGKVALTISNLFKLDEIRCQSLRKLLPPKFADRFTPPTTEGVWRPTPKLWEAILDAIGRQGELVASGIHDRLALVELSKQRPHRTEHGLDICERDAIAIATEAWGGRSARQRLLREANPTSSDKRAPFLSKIGGYRTREDLLIHHDQITFPGMSLESKDIIGAVVLSKPSGRDKLTVIECNRQPLEESLGVDLIYYNHHYDSFVLVQYKRLSMRGGSQPEYRPSNDGSHDGEISRMENAQHHFGTPDPRSGTTVDAYRLSPDAFYIKLCKSDLRPTLDTGLVSGMYFPLKLWKSYLDSEYTRGERGATVFTWNRCPKYLSNTGFTDLLRDGWIGTSGAQSELLQQIIESVLENGRMAIVAGTSPDTTWDDYCRDSFGQFASPDPPGTSN